MLICKCNKQFDNNRSYVGHVARCDIYKNWINSILTQEYLYNEYVTNGKATSEIAQDLGLKSSTAIVRRMQKYNIKLRSISESLHMKRARERSEATCVQRYGGINVLSKGTIAYKKRNKTVLKKYGVNNVFQVKEIRDKFVHNTSKSKLNEKIYKLLGEMGVKFEKEFRLKMDNNKSYFYDLKIGDTLIEINGKYWHAEPRIYDSDAVLSFKGKKYIAKDIWNRDRKKIDFAKKCGYKTKVLWEIDIIEERNNLGGYLCKQLSLR